MEERGINRIPDERPLVSIIIPCYNGQAYISDAIESATSQTYRDTEVIFVDDGSSDGSLDVARQFSGISIISQDNSGVSTARNVGLSKSKGKFILFLDADDRLDSDAVRLHLDAFSNSESISMVYGSNRIIDSEGRVIGYNAQARRAFSWENVLMGITPTPSQSMFKRDALLSVGSFDAGVSLGEDFDLYLRLTAIGPGYCHGNCVTDYRIHPFQATKNPSSSLLSTMLIVERFRESMGTDLNDNNIWRLADRHWRTYFGQYIPFEIIKSILKGDLRRTCTSTRIYIRHLPYTFEGTLRFLVSRIAKRLTK